MSFLYWLESIRCPFLDAVMQAFTCFGEELAFLLLALTIFWCVSKEEGYYLLFVGFFGYYPILKGKLEKIRSRALEYAAKFLVFNIAVIASYLVIIYLFGLQGVLEDVGPLGQYSVLALLALGNVVLWIYDVALSRIITAYREVLRKKIFRRIG